MAVTYKPIATTTLGQQLHQLHFQLLAVLYRFVLVCNIQGIKYS
jgi:hypothetical protein